MRQHRHHCHAGRFHARHGAQRAQKLPVKLASAVGLISVERRVHRERQDIVGFEPWVQVFEISQAPDEQTSRDQEHQ